MLWMVCEHHKTRSTLVGLVEAKGYAVEGMDCGDALRTRIRFQSPQLIVIDCSVSESFEMIREIRDERHTRSTPIIMFSRDEQNLKEKALAHGADAYVPKGSLDWMELLQEIQKFARP